jgi:hypothetical protein
MRPLRLKSLSSCIAALLAIDGVAATAVPSGEDRGSVQTVMNCNDAGPGSLRDAAFNAAAHSTIDLGALQCSQISLSSGEIAITADDVTVKGPGIGPQATHTLTIDGGAYYGYRNRIFEAGGKLTVSGLILADAQFDAQSALAKGGCVYSGGDLVIEDSAFFACEVDAPYGSNAIVFGGGAYAGDTLSITGSVIVGNRAYSAASTNAYGGGMAAGGFVTIQNTMVAYNEAVAPGAVGIGGGIAVVGWGDVAVFGSAIFGNAAVVAGGLRVDTLGGVSITNSTLSGNYALYIGGASLSAGTVTLTNSTIAQNSAYSGALGVGIYSESKVDAESTILADNVDRLNDGTFDIVSPNVEGAANLITWSSGAIPPDTVTACPRLTALDDHGGLTWTHALIAGSPGINAGSNTIPLDTDQRGEMPYVRVFGAHADIGAYEWQGELDDHIFKSAFETRCDRYD